MTDNFGLIYVFVFVLIMLIGGALFYRYRLLKMQSQTSQEELEMYLGEALKSLHSSINHSFSK